MNNLTKSISMLALTLSLASCNAPAPDGGSVADSTGSSATGPKPADAADSLNCKIEMLNGEALKADKLTDALPVHGPIEASGWVMLKGAQRAPAEVVVEFVRGGDNREVAHDGVADGRVDRPDVDAVFSANSGSKAGFIFKDPANKIADGAYQLRIVGKDSGSRYICPNTVQIGYSAAAAN